MPFHQEVLGGIGKGLEWFQERVAEPSAAFTSRAYQYALPGENEMEMRARQLQSQGMGFMEAATQAYRESEFAPGVKGALELLDPTILLPGIGFGGAAVKGARAASRAALKGVGKGAAAAGRAGRRHKYRSVEVPRGAAIDPEKIDPILRKAPESGLGSLEDLTNVYLPKQAKFKELDEYYKNPTLAEADRPAKEVVELANRKARHAGINVERAALGHAMPWQMTTRTFAKVVGKHVDDKFILTHLEEIHEALSRGIKVEKRVLDELSVTGVDDVATAIDVYSKRVAGRNAAKAAKSEARAAKAGKKAATGKTKYKDTVHTETDQGWTIESFADEYAAKMKSGDTTPLSPAQQQFFTNNIKNIEAQLKVLAGGDPIFKGLGKIDMIKERGQLVRGHGAEGATLKDNFLQAVVRAGKVKKGTAVQFLDEEADLIKNMVRDSATGEEMSVITKAFKELKEGGKLGSEEIRAMRFVFGDDALKVLAQHAPARHATRELLYSILGLPQLVVASFDVSATLRQGGFFLPARMKESRDAFAAQIKAIADPKTAREVERAIRGVGSPEQAVIYEQAMKAKLYQAPLEGGALSAREDWYFSQFADKIPGIRRFAAGYNTYLNKLRMDIFATEVNSAKKGGKAFNEKQLKDLARYINWATGRGPLPMMGEGTSTLLRSVFWAPRFVTSRLALPATLVMSDLRISRIIAKDMVLFFLSRAAMISLPIQFGLAAIELDPRSSDFGKLRVGKARIDPWAGFLPPIRYAAQVATGKGKVLATGQERTLQRGQTLFTFARSKMSPLFGTAWDFVEGETFTGEKLTPFSVAKGLTVPITVQDLVEGVTELGEESDFFENLPDAWPWGFLMAAAGGAGLGVQAFPEPGRSRRYPGMPPLVMGRQAGRTLTPARA